ncbi:MAG: LytTR family DNA-binding domain-containing protein [Oscillospiraceae bacterium]|nr:LytTR family DNA-binding domain-containing protein [Oscillospiraceae bacterium]
MALPLKIAICEDIPQDAAQLKEWIGASGVPAEVSLFESGEAFLAARPSRRFHLVFMDIYLNGMSGVETARALRETDKRCQIVFITTSAAHALESYGVDAMQYLVKPGGIGPEVIAALLGRVERLREKIAAEVCPVVSGGRRRDIPLGDILFAEVYDKQCHIHVLGEAGRETVVALMRLDELAALLPPPRFLRCHRSNIVNLEHVVRIRDDFILSTGDLVYVRRGDRTKCEIALNEWHLAKAAGDIE